MNNNLKNFLLRGFFFAGLGPVVLGIVFAVLENSVDNFQVNGLQICLGIISTYILAFVQAGATVFNQIENWPVSKSLLCHFSTLYAAYILCYLINSWIPFKPQVILIFTMIFIAGYLLIWAVVYFSIKATGKKMNKHLN